jgi:uncharacterized protein (TIRG00374 family)
MVTKAPPSVSVVQAVRYLLVLILLGLAVHLLIPQITSLEHSVQVIRQMALWAVALAVIAQAASYLGSGYLLKAIVQLSESTLSIGKATLIVLAAASLGMVAGGMVGSAAATYRWMQKERVKPEVAGLAGTIPGLFNDSILVLVSLVGLIHLLMVHQLTRLQVLSYVLILLFLGALVGGLVWGFAHRPAITQLAHRIGTRWSRLRHRSYIPEKTDGWLTGLFDAWNLLVKGGWRGPFLGAALNVAFDMLTLYFLFIAAGYRVSLGVLLTGYGLPLLLGKMAFMIPGGVGVIESTMVGLYTGLGVPTPVTVVVVLAYRILSFWLPLLLGFPLIMVLQRKRDYTIE